MNDAEAEARRGKLLAYVDGRLGPAAAREVEAWLADRPDEARQAAAWRRQGELLKAALDPVASEPVPARITAALLRHRADWRSAILAAAAAALIALPSGVMLGWLWWGNQAANELQQLAHTALANHQLYTVEVRHPVEVGAHEEQHLLQWLTKRLRAPVRAPDLSSDGLSLLGGRLISAGGEPGALLMYESSDGQRFALLTTPLAGVSATAFRYAEADSIAALYWVDNDLGYVVTGPADRGTLLNLAQAIHGQIG